MTPLHLAAGTHNLAMVQYLIREGAETDCTDEHGRCAFFSIAQ